MKHAAVLLLCLLACQTAQPAPTPPPQAPPPKPDARTVWKAVIDAPDRSEKDRALDAGRHPAETLEFLDLKPGMKVADLGAGGGYTTELIARAVGPSGAVYMQNDPRWLPFLKEAIEERYTHPAAKSIVRVDRPFDDPLPPEAKNLDEVVINVIYHDIVNMPVDRVRSWREVFNALQPGGAFVVIDSSAKPGTGLQDTATLHRIDEQVVKDEVQKAGFKLAGESDFLRNPQDTRDWNSSPGAAAKAGKRGTSDRFALRFVRPEGSGQQIIPPHVRLPEGARPSRITAELVIDPEQPVFHGTEKIELTLDAATPLLWLNAHDLRIIDTDPKSTAIDAQPGFVGLQFAQPLPAGAATLQVQWEGKLPAHEDQGAHRQQENGKWYVLTQGEALGMRRIFPCFDEPSFKIPWKISLRVPRADAAYFNTPVEATEDAGDAKLFHFAETRPLPSYLLAFGVGPFARVDAGKAKTGQPVGIVVTDGKTAWAKYSAQSSPKLLNLIADYFRVPYHYPKLDLIEVPLGGGAMENPGLITFAQRINLAKPGTDTPQFMRRAASVEAHEFAHLWFGDMVTTAWWDDLWLNEAFATWMTGKTIEQFAPSWGAPGDRAASLIHAMDEDSLTSARRIRQPIESEGDINNAFDAITYDKGAAVIGMFEQWIGPEQFRKGVTRYLEGHADGNATAKEFLTAISAEAGKDVAPAFSTFLDQNGLPLVKAKLVCENGKGRLDLSQSRYLPLGSGPAREQAWQVPVCARTSAGRTCMLLTDKSGTLDLGACPQWVVTNAGASGYYRSALDDDAIARLTGHLAQLTPPERMLLFSDVDAAAHAGTIDFARSFQLIETLGADKDRHVVEALLPTLRYVRSRGLLTEESLAKFGAFVRDVFSKRAHQLGFAEKKGEPDDVRILRPSLLRVVGDEGGDLLLRSEAQKLALRWLADHKAASPELAQVALYLSAIDGDALLFDKLHAAAKAEPDRVERQRILEALGSFRDPELAQKGFAIFLSGEFEAREAVALLRGAADDPRTRDAAIGFVEKNFDAIAAKMPHDYPSRLPSIGEGACDEEHAAGLGQSFRPRASQHPGIARKLAEAMEGVRQCAAFREKEVPGLVQYLKSR
ncbi:MAG: M1 family aminopeptidase [Myxococcales bacterium]